MESENPETALAYTAAGSFAMMVSIASKWVAEGVDVYLFDGPFRVGLPMSVLLFGGKELASGR